MTQNELTMKIDLGCLVAEKGDILGTYKNKPIYDYFIDGTGRNFTFDRIAIEDKGGLIDLSQLTENECVLSPGLIYKRA